MTTPTPATPAATEPSAESDAPRTTFTLDTFTLLRIQEEAWEAGWQAAWSPMSMHDLDDSPNPFRRVTPPGMDQR